MRTRLTSDFDHIFKSGGRDESYPRAFSLQEGVGADRRAMEKREVFRNADFL